MRVFLLSIVCVWGFAMANFAFAQMSSTNFQIEADTLSSGGLDTASSASYLLRDTVGNQGAGNSTGSSYGLDAGYRGQIFDQVITFELFSQQNGSQRSATALASTTITCSTTSLSVGDFVALVQDKGVNQITGIGKISSIGVGEIVLDSMVTNGVMTIDGSNDYVYKLTGTTASFETLANSLVSTVVIGFNVSADLENGYTVQAFNDGDLRDGVNTIPAVSDGAVSVGVEEYGARSSDASIAGSSFDTQDSPFSLTSQIVADETSSIFESRHFVTLKASISGATTSGSYAQSLSFIASGTY